MQVLQTLWHQRIHSIAAPDAADAIDSAIQQVKSGAPAAAVEYPVDLHGSNRCFEVGFVPLREQQILAIIRDITARRTAEVELERSSPCRAAPSSRRRTAFWLVDAAGTIDSFNRQFAAIWRIPDEVLRTRDDSRAFAFSTTGVSFRGPQVSTSTT